MRSPRRREGTYRMQLNASTRQIAGKRSRQLHREGKLAAVVYGHAAAATPIVLDRVVDGSRTEKVLIREIQTHPRRLGPIHVDFYQVNLEEKIRVEVPVHLIGESAAVKRGDADVLQPIHALEVECLPTEIPEGFEVDLTPLAEIDDGLRVSELAVPKGITILADPEELVVKIVHKRELKIEEEVPVAEGEVPAEGEGEAAEGVPAEGEQAETEE